MTRVILIILMAAICGCAGVNVQQRRQAYIAAHPEMPEARRKDMLEGYLWTGMSPDEARASWGEPCEINHSGGAGGSHDQWVYGVINVNTATSSYYVPPTCAGKPYLYFDDGKLTRWQN